ncbi:MAG TPA: ribonuclease HII [Saprospiraceae bacterium]|nr:ribonuclease HII [Saprospiraceae bacterium]
MKKTIAVKLKSYYKKGQVEIGCDEAGRGCLAGPVVAAAVILPSNFKSKLIRDSKKMSFDERQEAKAIIMEKAISFAIGILDNHAIDKHNILNASFLAMHQALDQMNLQGGHLLIDGNRFIPYRDFDHTCIIKGDDKFLSIAAASILAKCHRDDIMVQLHEQFPMYGWMENKGYPTELHRQAIIEHGHTNFHRRSFRLYPDPLQLNLFQQTFDTIK